MVCYTGAAVNITTLPTGAVTFFFSDIEGSSGVLILSLVTRQS
jgi:hypothetical protein